MVLMKTTRNSKATKAAWQLNPLSVTSGRVQFWTREGTMAGLVSLENAREHVSSGACFAINDQAIGQF